MALQSSFSSSSSFSYVWKYDVFLNFRGQDTRYGFIGHLYKTLCDKGIQTFIDDEELQRGEEITPSLVKAIDESRIAIAVFSKNYASSSFCLDELVKIMECINGKGRLVLPVFYDVDPSHVRHQTGTYSEALARHEVRFKDNMDKVCKWRKALHRAANLSGLHLKYGNGYEHEFIGKIVEEVSRKIKRIALHVADYPVGLEPQVEKVNSLLDVGLGDGVCVVGIYGIGGIGKTTLALAVYNSIADHFEGLCFLANVRENSNKHGLVHLQSDLLYEVLGEKNIKLTSIQQGISIIQHRLQRKKVLLILDDVDKHEQLQAIAGKPDWFGRGSRVIITTQDKHLLVCHGIERTYEVEGLNKAEALELFSWKAFKSINVSPTYADVLNRAITYACGLPLALEVIGSNLFGKSVEDWESALDGYEKIPNNKIQKILKVSFDALEEDEQNVFLDIACCFKGYQFAEVKDILCAHHGSCMKYHIGVLVEKSLIKIGQVGHVTLHDLIEDMGKEIVRQQSQEIPGLRNRLWFYEDIVQVLEDNQGTDKIEIIYLDFPLPKREEAEVAWDGNAFEKMKNLKTLIIRNAHFSEGPKYLPNSLRVLEWWGYPSEYLPSNFHRKNLSILKLPRSCLMSLMLVGKKFVNMKVLKLDGNSCLTQIPDVSGCPNLEDLSFLGCQNLITVHDSVGLLGKLKILDARWCYELRSFPPIKLPSLKELYLSECRSLESFPEILGKMENITELDLGCTGIYEFPFSFRNLSRLQRLSLFTMGGKFRIPSCIAMMPELTGLAIHAYNGERLSPKQDEIEEIVSSTGSSNAERLRLSSCEPPDDFFPLGLACFANAKELDLSFGGFTILPECIKECRLLRKLSVDERQDLREIRGIPPNLEHFSATNCRSLTSSCSSMLLNQDVHEAGNTMFFLPAARIPEWFENQIRGPSISFWFRNKFPALALCLTAGPVVECRGGQIHFDLTVIINGRENFCRSNLYHSFFIEMDHIFLIDLQKIKFDDNMDEALSGNEWNHAELSIAVSSQARIYAKERAIHVFKEKSNMEDIQFIDPYKRRKLNDSLCSPDSSCKRRKLDDGLDSPDPGSMVSTKISGTTSIDGLQMQLQLLKL